LIGDAGSHEAGGRGFMTAWDISTTGRNARYRPLDFFMLEAVLGSLGYSVAVERVPAFCHRLLPGAERHFAQWYAGTAVESGTFIAVVSRPGA